MRKAQTETRINLLVEELEAGRERAEIFRKYGRKWDLTIKGLDPILKKARQRASDRLQARNTITDKVRAEEIEASARASIVGHLEVDGILSQILNGTYETEEIVPTKDGFKVVRRKPTQVTIIRALDIFYRRFGHYPPIKNQHTVEPGAEVKEFSMTFTTINSKDDLKKDDSTASADKV